MSAIRMFSRWSKRLTAFGLACSLGSQAIAAGVQPLDKLSRDEFSQKATWKSPTAVEARAVVDVWLKERNADADTVKRIDELWSAAGAPTSGELLDLVAASFAAADPQARELVALCSAPRTQVITPKFAWLTDDKTPAVERENLRLLLGRWLVQHQLHDEALEQLEGLKTESVVDPATLLFYQAIVHQRTLNREAGLAAVGRLLERPDELPRRYESLARLMQADLTGLKPETLDHISRRMDDVRRRLDLGRAGPKVREVEDGIIKSLDKLIEEMEAAAAAAAAAAQASGGQQIRSASPAQESKPMGGKGPGEVARKDVGSKSGWGDLPPKQRQEALQQIGKDFPGHYRDVVEQYFRKLASEDSAGDKK